MRDHDTTNPVPYLIGVVTLAVSLFVPLRASAWGEDGHKIVAAIAQLRLRPTTAAAIQRIYATDDTFCAGRLCTKLEEHDVALWADDWKKPIDAKHTDPKHFGHKETGHWHYLNAPIAEEHASAADCGPGSCVSEQIAASRAALTSATGADQFAALRFMVHFVGDVHQPLHCEDNNDGGGNSVILTFPGHTSFMGGPPELHGVWDTDVITAVKDHRTFEAYAKALNDSIAPADLAAWRSAQTPMAWAEESHALAQSIYQELHLPILTGTTHPQKDPSATLDETYGPKHRALIEQQLQRAGVRLADLLNATLDPAGELTH